MSSNQSNGVSNLVAAELSQAAYTPLSTYQSQGNAALSPALAAAGWTVDVNHSAYGTNPDGSPDLTNQFVTFVNTTSGTPQVMVVFKGSDNASNFASDFENSGASAWQSISGNLANALTGENGITATYPGATVMTDGHSLGGGMAQTASLVYGLSGYGQNSLPISQGAIQQSIVAEGGTLAGALSQWKAASNTFSEVNNAGDPATLLYSTVENQTYLSTSTTTLSNPYVAGEIAGLALSAIPGLNGVGAALTAWSAYESHTIGTIVSNLSQQQTATGDSSAANSAATTNASAIVSSAESAALTSNSNGSISVAIGTTPQYNFSVGSIGADADTFSVSGGGQSTQTVESIIAGSGQTYSSTLAGPTSIFDLSGGNQLNLAGTGNNVVGSKDSVSLAQNAQADLVGNTNSISASGNDSLTLSGSSNTLNTGANVTANVTGGANTINVNGTGDNFTASNDSVSLSANTNTGISGNGNSVTATGANVDSSLIGNNDTVTSTYTGNAFAMSGSADTFNVSGDGVTFEQGSGGTVIGNGDAVAASGSGVGVTLVGSSDTVTSTIAGNGFAATGSNDTFNISGDGVTFEQGSGGTVNGNGDGIAAAGSGVDVTLIGSSDTTTSTIAGNGFAATGSNDTFNVSGDGVTFEQGSGGSVNGNGDGIAAAGSGVDVTLNGNGDWVSSNVAGNGFAVTGSSDTFDVSGDGVTFEQGSGGTVNGNGDGIAAAGSGVGVTLNGSGDWVSSNVAGNGFAVTGSNDTFDVSGDGVTFEQGSGGTVNGNGDGIAAAGANVGVTLNGSYDTVTSTVAGNGFAVTGTGDVFNLTGDGVTFEQGSGGLVNGNGDGIAAAGNGVGVTVDGNGDTLTSTYSGNSFAVNGSSDGFYITGDALNVGQNSEANVDGSHDSITEASHDLVDVDGSYDASSGNSSDTTDYYGGNYTGDSGSGDISADGGTPSDGLGAEQFFGYYGFAGNQSVVNAAVGSNIGSIAQYDLSHGDQTAAAAAEAGLHQADQIATATPTSGTGSSVLEGAKWDSQVVTWSLATLPGTDAAQFSSDMSNQYATEVQQAFATWGAASGITFEEVSDSSQSDVRLGWSNLGTSTTGVVGYTSFQAQNGAISPDAIIQLEDPSQDALVTGTDGQQTYSGTDATLSQVLLHEIGHALGLADSADQNSIMYYELNSTNRTLDATDIAGIQSLYGAGSTGTSVTQLIQAMSAFAPSTSAQSSIAIADHSVTPQDMAVH